MELQGSRSRTVRKNIENEFENNRTFYKLNQSEFKKGNQIQEGESDSRRGIRVKKGNPSLFMFSIMGLGCIGLGGVLLCIVMVPETGRWKGATHRTGKGAAGGTA
jgi:hypothetical protein